MNGDDIKNSNLNAPWFPDDMSWWNRVFCVLGYHKRETRQTAKGHRYGPTKEYPIGRLHDENPMTLRDQCGRCGALLDEPKEVISVYRRFYQWACWATVDEACELSPLRWWVKLARRMLPLPKVEAE